MQVKTCVVPITNHLPVSIDLQLSLEWENDVCSCNAMMGGLLQSNKVSYLNSTSSNAKFDPKCSLDNGIKTAPNSWSWINIEPICIFHEKERSAV